jgi:hypothetical protein
MRLCTLNVPGDSCLPVKMNYGKHWLPVVKDSGESMEWCCYKTVDFAMAASQNGVCITQGKCHNDLVSQFLYDKRLNNKKCNIFLS